MLNRISPALFFLILITSISSVTKAQFYIINDKDGFVNVRESAGMGGNLICQLNNGMVVRESLKEDTAHSNWILVEFYVLKRNAAKIKTKAEDWKPEVMSDHALFSGYIYKDKLLGVEGNNPLERKETGNELLLFNNSTRIKISRANFQKEKHKIQAQEMAAFKIDGRPFIGTDGEVPRVEIKAFTVEIAQKKVNIPKTIFSDLYQPNFSGSDAYSDAKGNLYIIMYNSDAAGSYSVIFIIDAQHRVTRYVFAGDC